MDIKIAGPGCSRCVSTERNVVKALADLSIQADVQKISDVESIVKLGVRLTPAVVVDGRVVASGRVPTVDELKALLAPTQ